MVLIAVQECPRYLEIQCCFMLFLQVVGFAYPRMCHPGVQTRRLDSGGRPLKRDKVSGEVWSRIHGDALSIRSITCRRVDIIDNGDSTANDE